MSAFLVSNDTLDLLASAACDWREDLHIGGLNVYTKNAFAPRVESIVGQQLSSGEFTLYELVASDREAIKRELFLENCASLQARYGDNPNDLEANYEKAKYISKVQATYAQVLGALACYEYQACETNEWSNSFAYYFCQALRKKICGLISEGHWEYNKEQVNA